ncbi:sulfatase-like hydrolase/transferase [Natronorubrum bangense]|uniref:N-acetylgalactosamine-4-sulfatase n=2 Tax=Natronorubrum bangense TaxID=61858 RepID=L9WAJ5_9EURY|nr:sulfatase-like hydrolase/transferase [Natronorubrum bangense]ELY45338.1 N-acetylgalactosamine-4-sulfatase [Natronorubrum bangense JCM 10635]QCC56817.1 hypothetical protein DV706_19970 [Natronorubrum bangense]
MTRTQTRPSPLGELDTDAIENVYLFIADSVRYDCVPDRVVDRGRLFKTAAAALCTPQSVPSIVTGRHAPRHGVTWFNDSLNESLPTLFDLDATTGYNEVVWEGRAVNDILNEPGRIDLESVEEPFVALEHDNGGHSPYVDSKNQSTAEMFSNISDERELRRRYRETVAASTDRFEERLDVLEDQDLLESTLVIYLADHGELLGEHGGFVGHGLPAAPEVAYVPTVFIHESLASETAETFIHHTDLFPTIDHLVDDGRTSASADGDSLLEVVDADRPAYTQGVMRPQEKYRGTILDPNYDAPSIWTKHGGFVFNDTSKLVLPLTATFDALFSGYTGAFNDSNFRPAVLARALRHYLSGEQTYGTPSVSRTDARAMADQLSSITVETESRSLDEETKEHLEQLGYR